MNTVAQMSRFVQLVTQWMSQRRVTVGRARNSP